MKFGSEPAVAVMMFLPEDENDVNTIVRKVNGPLADFGHIWLTRTAFRKLGSGSQGFKISSGVGALADQLRQGFWLPKMRSVGPVSRWERATRDPRERSINW